MDPRDPEVRLRALLDPDTLKLLAPLDSSGVVPARGEIHGTPVIAFATDASRMGGAMRRRLLELGLVPGTRAECLLRAPSGSPAAYLVRGAVIALRQCDAARVEIGCGLCG